MKTTLSCGASSRHGACMVKLLLATSHTAVDASIASGGDRYLLKMQAEVHLDQIDGWAGRPLDRIAHNW